MAVKTVKNVEDTAWFELKSQASRNDMPVGKMLEKMVAFYRHRSEGFWSRILSGEKLLSEKEAKDMENIVKKSRKEYGFRG